MVFDVVRIITLVILWVCIALNWYTIILNIRNGRRYREEHRERLAQMEEWFEEARRNYQKALDNLINKEKEESEKNYEEN